MVLLMMLFMVHVHISCQLDPLHGVLHGAAYYCGDALLYADIDVVGAFMLVNCHFIFYFPGLDCLQQYTGLVDHNN